MTLRRKKKPNPKHTWTLECTICGYNWTTREAVTFAALWSSLSNVPSLPCGCTAWGGAQYIVDVKDVV